MTNKRVFIGQMDCPLSVNIKRFAEYLLPTNERIFFDWLTTKQAMMADCLPFYYSKQRIEQETGIKKDALDKIVKRFEAMGILSTEIRTNNIGGKNRYFFMDFAKVVEHLPEIVDKDSDFSATFGAYFQALAGVQRLAVEEERASTANELYTLLNDTYKSRVRAYNKTSDRQYAVTQLARNNATDTALLRLAKRYDNDTIEGAFIAYCDDWLRGNITPEHPIIHFATYDPKNNDFPTFVVYLVEFQTAYTRKVV